MSICFSSFGEMVLGALLALKRALNLPELTAVANKFYPPYQELFG